MIKNGRKTGDEPAYPADGNKTSLEVLKEEDPKKYVQMKKKFEPVKFYRIKGIEIDSEVQEHVQGTDLVKLRLNLENTYTNVQYFLLVTSIFVIVAYSVVIPRQFDFDLIDKIVAASKADTTTSKTLKHDPCGNPAYFTEKENKVGLFFMIICHIFMAGFVSTLKSFKLGFDNSFRTLYINDHIAEFEKQAPWYVIGNFAAWGVFGSIALGINYIYGASGFGGNFGKMSDQCATFRKTLYWKSMINMWILVDIILSAISMLCLWIQYQADKNYESHQWFELLIHTQENALKNFYRTDATAQAKADDRKIITRLTNRIYNK